MFPGEVHDFRVLLDLDHPRLSGFVWRNIRDEAIRAVGESGRFQIVELVDRIARPVHGDSELGQDLGFAHRGDIAGPVETLCPDGMPKEHAELLRVNVRGFSQISVQRIDRLRGREASEAAPWPKAPRKKPS